VTKTTPPTPRNILETLAVSKVITVIELAGLLNRSVKTARRCLKAWGAYTSYNYNGRYYALPAVAEFDANGLWSWKGIRFSCHGTLKATVLALVEQSEAGLTAIELSRLLGLGAHAVLSLWCDHPDLRREKQQGRFVYFSADRDTHRRQQTVRRRLNGTAGLPSDAEAVAILAEAIRSPWLSAEELCQRLRAQCPSLTSEGVANLFTFHGLTPKKTPPLAT